MTNRSVKPAQAAPKFNTVSTFPPVKIEIEKMSEVKETDIKWLWKDRLAFGKMTLIAGEPGVGKSQFLMYVASILSKGGRFHYENSDCEAGNVLIISGEDNSNDTIKPRLMALDADMDRIHNVKGIANKDRNGNAFFDPICLVDNLSEIESLMKKHKYKMIIVDPISLYLGSIDENKNKEIRGALSRISAMNERNNSIILMNSHFTKPSGNATKSAIYRIMGSIGFVAASRIAIGIMKDPEDASRRLFIPIKNNLGKDDEGFVYKIKPSLVGNNIATSRIEWLKEKISTTANEILNSVNERPSPRLEEAKEFLKDLLKFGSVSLTDIRSKATESGFSIDTLYTAKKSLNVQEESAFDRKRGKIWFLPST